MPFLLNWQAGWLLILLGFATGGLLGLGFHHESFLGGYAHWRRRLLRLGHVALIALGALNILFAVSVEPSNAASLAGVCWIVGAIAMPTTCVITAFRRSWWPLFVIPVAGLLTAALATLAGAPQ